MEKIESYRRSRKIKHITTIVLLSILSLFMLLPFWWMISTSFDWSAVVKLPFPPRFWPEIPSLKAYKITFTNVPMLRYILNTFVVVAGMILVSGLSALLSGYALSKIRFKGRNFVLLMSLSVLMIPFEVTMIPQYLLFNQMKLLNTYFAFWLPGISYVFGTFFAKQYMDTIPDTLREAAMIDGANELSIFLRIYLPLCGPIIATLTVLLFLSGWNDLLWPLLVLSDPKKYTIQIGVAMFTYNQGLNQMPAIRMASALVSIIPVLIVYLFLQRYIVESIALTGIKQ